MSRRQPMLAATADNLSDIVLPCYAQYKLDGIRCWIAPDHTPLSRKLKPIPNVYVHNYLKRLQLPIGLDGELLILDLDHKTPYRYLPFNDIQSAIMSEDGVPQFEYVVFDWDVEFLSFSTRWARLLSEFPCDSRVVPVTTRLCKTTGDLTMFEECALLHGMEGIITRSMTGFYKYGRSTLREQSLIKYKRFHDSEAVVVGFNELMHNMNVQTTDERGYAKRSKHQDGLMPSGLLGNLIVKDDTLFPGVTFEIGTGFTEEQRKEIWKNQSQYKGRTVTYKYQKHGTKDRPRIPVFKAWRLP